MGSHQPALPGTSRPAWGQVSEGRRPHGLQRSLGRPWGSLWEWVWACMMDLGGLSEGCLLTPKYYFLGL